MRPIAGLWRASQLRARFGSRLVRASVVRAIQEQTTARARPVPWRAWPEVLVKRVLLRPEARMAVPARAAEWRAVQSAAPAAVPPAQGPRQPGKPELPPVRVAAAQVAAGSARPAAQAVEAPAAALVSYRRQPSTVTSRHSRRMTLRPC